MIFNFNINQFFLLPSILFNFLGSKSKSIIESCFLNLDEIDPEKFESYMKEALECECIIGEMFSGEDKKSPGNGHTTNPHTWINRFKDRH
jgi:hypothetical protein